MTLKICRALLFVALLLVPHLGWAVPMQSAPSAQLKSNFMPAAAEIGQQIQALVTGDANVEIEPQETFGTRALGIILDSLKLIGSEGTTFITNFAALPQLATWCNQQITDAALWMRWTVTIELLVMVVGGSFAAGWLVDLVLLPLRRRIYKKHHMTAWSRFWSIFYWLLLSLVPVIVFVGAALLIIDQSDPNKLVRFIVMTVVYALALLRLVRVVLRFFLAPRIPNLRFVPLSTPAAFYIQSWVTWFGVVMVLFYFLAEIARVFKVPLAAISGFTNLAALIVVVMTIVVILQKRSAISSFIRGELSAARATTNLFDSLRLWAARSWHVLAISYLVIGYIVTMLGAGGGFTLMQQGTIGTLLTLLFMRLAFYLVSRATYQQKHEGEVNSGIYKQVLGLLFKLVIWVAGLASVVASWGVDVSAIASSAWGQRVLGSVFSVTSVLLIVVLIYELLNAFIERKLNRRDSTGRLVQANARARTLLPMVQKAAIMILSVIVGLVILSELGINIAPLLAGAGVLGVAVGFGSQTLVKDFLTGLSIILEDNIAVGDSVIIGGDKGIVENMSIRTIRLRDVNGSLHIIPYSVIGTITNESKNFAFALMDIGVSYDSDLDQVIAVLKKAGEDLRAEPFYQDVILDAIEVMGVESLGDSAVVIRSRIRTKAGRQSEVRRAFLLHIKKAFDAAHIEIPFPTVMQVQRDSAAKAQVLLPDA